MIRWQIAQWFELQWWKRYLKGKDKQQYLIWKRNYWQQVLNQVLTQVNLQPTSTVADLGCGPAGIFIALPQNKVTAVDPLLIKFESTLPFFKRSDYPNVTFITSTIEAFETSEKFDRVFCMNAINHVHNIQQGFGCLRKACKPGGVIAVSIDAHNFPFFKYLFRAIPGDILHPHQYDLNEYKNFVDHDGWKTTQTVLLKQEFFFNHYLLIAKRN